jgi:hypothetical protein
MVVTAELGGIKMVEPRRVLRAQSESTFLCTQREQRCKRQPGQPTEHTETVNLTDLDAGKVKDMFWSIPCSADNI